MADTGKDKSYSPDDFWRRTFNWELVRGFGQSRLATISIAMPFIGYALLYHAEIESIIGGLGGYLDAQIGDTEVVGQEGARSGGFEIELFTRLSLIYLGTVLIGVGTIVYRLIAPKTVKEFRSVSHFVEVELSRATARRLRSMMVTISARRPQTASGLFEIAPWLRRSHCKLKAAVGELKNIEDDQLQIDVLSSFYNVESRYTARTGVYVTVAFYVLGFIAVSIPGIAFTVKVLAAMHCQWFCP